MSLYHRSGPDEPGPHRAGFLVAVALMLLAASAVGCPPPNGDEGEVEIRLAPIHEVQVAFAESFPLQIIIHIEGGLADSCTTFHELTTERSDNVITITVTTQRPKGAACAQVYSHFEKNVNLGSDFASGETYTINVNDKTTSFVMP